MEEKVAVINAKGDRVIAIKVTLVMQNTSGDVNITDIMLQGGSIATKWSGHPSEMRWTVDG